MKLRFKLLGMFLTKSRLMKHIPIEAARHNLELDENILGDKKAMMEWLEKNFKVINRYYSNTPDFNGSSNNTSHTHESTSSNAVSVNDFNSFTDAYEPVVFLENGMSTNHIFES